MDAGDLAVEDGDRVVATGRLVRDERGDWFEPPVMIAAPGRAGVWVSVDLIRLEGR
jgi:hypothetical protein